MTENPRTKDGYIGMNASRAWKNTLIGKFTVYCNKALLPDILLNQQNLGKTADPNPVWHYR